jgi:hypothetical protein
VSDNRWFDAVTRARDVLADTESAARRPDVKAHDLPPYDSRPPGIGLVAWSIVLSMVALLALAVVVAHRDLRNIAARDAEVAATRDCEIPKRDGDMVVLTVRNRGGTLVAACRPVTDWRSPERAAR